MNQLRLCIFLLCWLCTTVPTEGATPLPIDTSGSYQPLDTIWQDFLTGIDETWLLFGRPLHFDAQDWTITGGILGVGTGIMTFDDEIRDKLQEARFDEEDDEDLEDVANVAVQLGRKEAGPILATGLYLTGLIFDEPKVRIMGRHLAQTLFYAGSLTILLKRVIGRKRPSVTESQYNFAGPWQNEDQFFSIPSGHTIVTYSIASSLSAEIGNPWVTVGLYGLAGFSSFGLLYGNHHWASDVFFTAALTSAIGHGLSILSPSSTSGDDTSFFITPTGNGVTLGWIW